MRTTALAAFVVILATLAPSAHAAEKRKFPGPVVNELLTGWNGVAWGGTLDEFKKKFPKASQNEAGRWLTGAGEEDLAGAKVDTQYSFNKKGQFYMITFAATDAAKATFHQTLADAGVLREGAKGNWTSQGVTFAYVDPGNAPVAVAINARFKDGAEKK
jgi:hypothetical protein